MDSLIKKFWFIHRMNEQIAIRLADAIICVNPNILARLEREHPRAARRAVFMPVAVDTTIFRPSEFRHRRRDLSEWSLPAASTSLRTLP